MTTLTSVIGPELAADVGAATDGADSVGAVLGMIVGEGAGPGAHAARKKPTNHTPALAGGAREDTKTPRRPEKEQISLWLCVFAVKGFFVMKSVFIAHSSASE
jgi:hypothetical protein